MAITANVSADELHRHQDLSDSLCVEYLCADSVRLQTSNAAVVGAFDVAQSLEIETSNGEVRTNVTMYHGGSRDTYPEVKLRTSNG